MYDCAAALKKFNFMDQLSLIFLYKRVKYN